MVYGSSEDQHAAIRGDGGKMLLDDDGFLPKDSAGQYMGGDVRSGENVGLTSLHTVFAREHNRIVDELADRDPDLSDDALYTLARRVVETEIQKITYDEFLPKILGEGALGDLAGKMGGDSKLGGIMSMLDQDGDGNPLDDIAGMASGLFGKK